MARHALALRRSTRALPRSGLAALATQALEHVSGGEGALLLRVVKSRPKLAAALVALLVWFARRLSQMKAPRGKHAPGPPVSIFSMGHMFQILQNFEDLPDWYHHLKKTYGHTVRLVMGSPLSPFDTLLIISHPDSLRHMLKDNFDNYPKGDDLIEYMHELFGSSIFAANGSWWYHQRKTASQIFTGNNMMNEMVKIMLDNSKVFVQSLKDASQNGAQAIDIQQMCLAFTMDSFCEIGFGISPGSLAADMPPKWKKFVTHWDDLQFVLPTRPFHPQWILQKKLAKLAKKGLPVGFLCKQEMHIMEMEKYVNDTIDGVIQQRLKDGAKTRHSVIAEGASPKNDSPKVGSSPRSPTSSPRGGRRNSSALDETKRLDAVEMFMSVEPPLSAVELRDVVKGLILGGRDTTGVSIMWALFEVGRNPEVQRKLRAECVDLPTEDPLAFYNALKGCKYLDAVIRETIRIYTPVPLDARKAANDDVFPDGTFCGKGWVVTFAPYVMARDKEMWGEDAESWRPERWFEGELAKKEPSPFVYSMFQAGPRICLGKDLALLEAKSCVALLVRAGVSFTLWPGEPEPRYKMGMTLAVEVSRGLRMKAHFQ